MHKTIVSLTFLYFVCIQGMQNNSWSITSYGTKINLTKGDIADASDRVDVIFVGYNQQEKFRKFDPTRPVTVESDNIGNIYCSKKRILYLNSDDYDSDSEAEYPLFIPGGYEVKVKGVYRPHINPVKKKIHCELLMIVEPCVKYFLYETISYSKVCKGMNFAYRGNDAIEQALKDLNVCYKNILDKILEECSEQKIKKIALPILSVEIGVPWDRAGQVGIKAIFEFVKHNPGLYDSIELFVKKRFEFDRYEKLCIEGSKLPQQISLLCVAKQDTGSNFSILPPELINYIASLI